MYQHHTIVGHLGQDSTVQTFQSGDQCIKFSVAVSEKWKDQQGQQQERTTWYNMSYFTKALGIMEYLKKGTQVLVTADNMKIETYDKSGGLLGISIYMRANTIRLLGSPKREDNAPVTPGPAQEFTAPSDPSFPTIPPAGGNDLPF